MRIKTIMVLALMVGVLAACGSAPAAATPETVIDGFKAAGLEVANLRPLVRDDLGMAPNMHEKALTFNVVGGKCTPEKDCHARVFQFKNDADLKKTETFYTELGRSSNLFYSHVFKSGLILMQINGDLPDDQAARYEAALKAMK